jgi:hypothetical protein
MGNNSVYIIGFEKSIYGIHFVKKLRKVLLSSHPDPYPEQQLFYRSDNAIS